MEDTKSFHIVQSINSAFTLSSSLSSSSSLSKNNNNNNNNQNTTEKDVLEKIQLVEKDVNNNNDNNNNNNSNSRQDSTIHLGHNDKIDGGKSSTSTTSSGSNHLDVIPSITTGSSQVSKIVHDVYYNLNLVQILSISIYFIFFYYYSCFIDFFFVLYRINMIVH